MRTIRQKTIRNGALAGLAAAASILLWAARLPACGMDVTWLLAASLATCPLLVCLWVKELRNLKKARLISENRIVSIPTAAIGEKGGGGAGYNRTETVCAIVSNFGVLLGSRVYEFNQGGAQLKGVEVGTDHIALTYGTESRAVNIRLFGETFSEEEQEKIAERFRYETGITPERIGRRDQIGGGF